MNDPDPTPPAASDREALVRVTDRLVEIAKERQDAIRERDALAADRDAFHTRYRQQCDVETKAAIARADAAEERIDVLAQQVAEAISESARRHEASQNAYNEVDAAWHDLRKRANAAEARAAALADALRDLIATANALLWKANVRQWDEVRTLAASLNAARTALAANAANAANAAGTEGKL